MDLATLAQQATDTLVLYLPFISAAGIAAADKSKDLLLEKGIDKFGSTGWNKARALLKTISPKMSESLEKALTKVSENSENPEAKEELQKEILKLLKEDQNLARKIELTINLNVENINNLALGNYNTFFNFETPSGDEYVKIIEYLDQRRKEAINQEIMNRYNSLSLPDYPDRLKEFVTDNRADELKKALTYLEKHKILLISGVGGVGKTTLARALVDLRPINVPEPFWFSFNDNQDAKLGDILEELAAYMKAPEITAFKSGRREPGKTDVDKMTGELNNRSEVWLFFDDLSIMLENTKFRDKGIELLFSSLRYRTHEAKIIITSRVLPKFGNGESLIDVVEDEEIQHLKGLETNFAVDYLAKNGLDSLELDELKRLAEDVDGHPLALKLLIGLVNKFGVSDTLKDLTRYKNLKESTIKKTRKLFNKLAGNEKELLERISVYRQAETMNAIEIMFTDNTPIYAADNLIDESLLETDHKGSYWLHPLVQEFSYDDLEDKKGAHKLAMEYYLSLSLPENPVKKGDVKFLIEAHYHAFTAEEYDKAFDIIFDTNLYEYLYLGGDYTVFIDLYSRLLQEEHLENKIFLGDKGKYSVILENLGLVYLDLGETRKAIEYYEQALKIARDIGDKRNEGNQLGNLGLAHYYLGDPKTAIEYYEQALKIIQGIGDKQGEGTWLGNKGLAYLSLGHPRTAIEYYEQALKIARDIGDKRNEGNQLGNKGLAYRNLGDCRKAIEYYEQALKIARDIGDRRGERTWLENKGREYCNLGETRKAIDYYEEALKIARDIGDRRGEGIDFGNLGRTYRLMGDIRKAIDYYEEALKIARDFRDRRGEGIELGNLGLAYRDLGETRKVIEYYEQSLVIARDIGDKRGEGICLGNLGLAFIDFGEPRKAIKYYEQALKIAQEIKSRRREGKQLGNLGVAYNDLGDCRKAIEYYEQALSIGREIEDPIIIGFCERNLEKLKNSKRETSTAIEKA